MWVTIRDVTSLTPTTRSKRFRVRFELDRGWYVQYAVWWVFWRALFTRTVIGDAYTTEPRYFESIEEARHALYVFLRERKRRDEEARQLAEARRTQYGQVKKDGVEWR